MAWIAVNRNGNEVIFEYKPKRGKYYWQNPDDEVDVPKGIAEKLTGKPMSWNDEPKELKNE